MTTAEQLAATIRRLIELSPSHLNFQAEPALVALAELEQQARKQISETTAGAVVSSGGDTNAKVVRRTLELARDLPLSVPGAHIDGLSELDGLVVPGRRSVPAPAFVALNALLAERDAAVEQRDTLSIVLRNRDEHVLPLLNQKFDAAEARAVRAERLLDDTETEIRELIYVRATGGIEEWQLQNELVALADKIRDRARLGVAETAAKNETAGDEPGGSSVAEVSET